MSQVPSVTSAQEALSVRNSRRMRRYMFTMAIRSGGLAGAVLTEGWIRWVCVVLAVVLPYVAVALGSESVDNPAGPTAYSPEHRELPPGRAGGEVESGRDRDHL